MKNLLLSLLLILSTTLALSQSMTINPIGDPAKDDTLRERFFLNGLTSINTTEELSSSLQGSQNLNITVRLLHQKEGKVVEKGKEDNTIIFNKPGFDILVGMNVLYLKSTGIARDSLDLNSLMFPETGNFGVMISPILHWYYKKVGKSVHRISSEVSYSLRHNKINDLVQVNSQNDTVFGPKTIEFTVTNINLMPFRYNFYYEPNSDLKVDFNFGLYYHIFNIPNEDAASMNKVFNFDKPLFLENKGSYINSIGMKFSCGINGFLLFADIRQNLNTTSLDDDNVYKGLVYNAGIAQNLSIYKK